MWMASSTSPPAGAGPSATSRGSIPRAPAMAGVTNKNRRIGSQRSIAAALLSSDELVEIRPQPAFGLLERHLTPPGIVIELIAADARDAEILAVAVAEIETRDGRG